MVKTPIFPCTNFGLKIIRRILTFTLANKYDYNGLSYGVNMWLDLTEGRLGFNEFQPVVIDLMRPTEWIFPKNLA